MATKTITKTSDRERVLDRLKEFLSNKPSLVSLIDNGILADHGICIGDLVLGEAEEEYATRFEGHLRNIQQLVNNSMLPKEVKDAVWSDLVEMDSLKNASLFHGADVVFETVISLFTAKYLVPCLKEFTAWLEESGGEA